MKRIRMLDWITVAFLLTAAIALTAPHQLPVTLYKLSLAVAGCAVGYWADRGLFPYARPDGDFCEPGIETAAAMIRRAIIVAACVVSLSLGA